MGGPWPWAAEELESCAGFLIKHGLHLTALELAQELQEVHKMPAHECHELDEFLAQLPTAVSGEDKAAEDERLPNTESQQPEDEWTPLGAAEREARDAEQRAALLEYELRICRQDFEEAARLGNLRYSYDESSSTDATVGTQRLSGLHLRTMRSRAVQTLPTIYVDAGTETDKQDSAPDSAQAEGSPTARDACLAKEEIAPVCIEQEPLPAATDTPMQWLPRTASSSSTCKDAAAVSALLQDAVVMLGCTAEKADFVAATAATLLELAQILRPSDRVVVAPILVRCANLQADAVGVVISRLLPWLLADELSSKADSPTSLKRARGASPQLHAASGNSRRCVLEGLLTIGLHMQTFQKAALPSILRYFQSKHIARRSLVAQLCGAWAVVSSVVPQATVPEADVEEHLLGFQAIFPVLLALAQDTAEDVRAVAAAAVIRRFRHGLWTQQSSKELMLLHTLLSDESPVVTTVCRHLLVPEVLTAGVCQSEHEKCTWKKNRLLLGPMAVEIARLAAHRLSSSPLSASEYGACLMRLRLALDLLLAILPALTLDAPKGNAGDTGTSEEEIAPISCLPLAGWEGGWCAEAAAAAVLLVKEDEVLQSWLEEKVPTLTAAGDRKASKARLPREVRERFEADLRQHATPDGRLPFDWSECFPSETSGAEERKDLGGEGIAARRTSAVDDANAAIALSLPVPDELEADRNEKLSRLIAAPEELMLPSAAPEAVKLSSDIESGEDATTEGAISDERSKQPQQASSLDVEDSDSEFSIASDLAFKDEHSRPPRGGGGGATEAKEKEIGVLGTASGVAVMAASSITSLWQQLPKKEVLASQLGKAGEQAKQGLAKDLERARAFAREDLSGLNAGNFFGATTAQVQGLDEFLDRTPTVKAGGVAVSPAVVVAVAQPVQAKAVEASDPQHVAPASTPRARTEAGVNTPSHPVAHATAQAADQPARLPSLQASSKGLDTSSAIAMLAFCVNGWVAAVAEVATLLDWYHPGHAHIFDSLCTGLEALVRVFGVHFRSAIVGPQLFQAGAAATGADDVKDAVGLYRIEHHGVPVHPLGSESPVTPGKLIYLSAGMTVNVLELVHREDLQRLQGRLETPPGWISLKSLESNYRWAVPLSGQKALVPKSASSSPSRSGASPRGAQASQDPIADPTLPVVCRIVVQHLPPESAASWLVEKTLQHASSAGARTRERWLWEYVATRADDSLRERLLTDAIWPAVSGDFGVNGQVVAAHVLDVLVMVFAPAELERLALPALFGLSDLAAHLMGIDDSNQASESDAKAAVVFGAIDALGRAWSRMQELSAAAVEKITIHFRQITENGGARVAEAGAAALGRVAVSCVSRQTLFTVLDAECYLGFLPERVQVPNVQIELARTLAAIASQEAIKRDSEACTKVRRLASALFQRSPLCEVFHFQKWPVGKDSPDGWRLVAPSEAEAHVPDVKTVMQKGDVLLLSEGCVMLADRALDESLDGDRPPSFNEFCVPQSSEHKCSHALLCRVGPPLRADIYGALKTTVAQLPSSRARQ